MGIRFVKATKANLRLRLALTGPAGAGKTYSALSIAKHLGGRVAVIDTERGSAKRYADRFDFGWLSLDPPFHPRRYLEAIKAAEESEIDVLIVDSISHAWNGAGGVLEIVEAAGKGNSFAGWKTGTPIQQQFVDGLLGADLHLIVTMRSKSEYVVEQNDRGKAAPRKVGTAPIQREGMDFEFDIVGDLDVAHTLTASKTRCPELVERAFHDPGEEFAGVLKTWLNTTPKTETT